MYLPFLTRNLENIFDLNDELKFDNVEQVSGDGNSAIVPVGSNMDISDSFEKHVSTPRKSTLIKRYLGYAPISLWSDYPCDYLEEEPHVEDKSLALVPYQAPKATIDREVHGPRTG